MRKLTTLGIDLASQPKLTAVCVVEWPSGTVQEPPVGVDDDELLALIRGAEKTGIDAPFGWPVDFVRAVSTGVWPADWRRRAILRATDHWVRRETGKTPMSVTADRIAYPAMRAAALLARVDAVDRTGLTGPVCETYPDPAIRLWAGIPPRLSYRGAAGRAVRATIVERLSLPAICVEIDHCLDAAICALVARAALLGRTVAPPPELAAEAAAEGWIHLPDRGLATPPDT